MRFNFFTFFILFFCGFGTAFGQTFHRDFYDGLIYVRITPGAQAPPALDELKKKSASDWQILYKKFGVTFIGKGSTIDHPALNRYYKFRFTHIAQTDAFLNALKSRKDVESAQLRPIDRPITPVVVPNDYQPASISWHLARIRAVPAWQYARGKKDVIIAIVDDAVKVSHADLNANIWTNEDEIPANGIDDDLNGFIDDVHGYDLADNDPNTNPPANATKFHFSHGTHCAGIAGAVTDNGIGLASISFNCRIMPIKCTPDASAQTLIEQSFEGVEYAIKNGADVISMSFGSYQFSDMFSSLMVAANSKGIVCVGGAGNDNNENKFYPSAYDFVVSVGATNAADNKADYSNYGNWIDVMAPGDLYSTVASGTADAYEFYSGTSMATPLVAGLCGLMRSYYPDKSADEILACLISSAKNINANVPSELWGKLGGGRIDALGALECMEPFACTADTFYTHFAHQTELNETTEGNFAGTNSRGFTRFAQLYDQTRGLNRLKRAGLKFGKANIQSLETKIQLKIWEIDYDNAELPGAELYSFDLNKDSIQYYTNKNEIYFFVPDTALAIPHRFYLGVEILSGGSDEIALYTSADTTITTLIGSAGDVWQTATQAWNQAFALGVFPFLKNDKSDLLQTAQITTESNGMLRFFADEPNGAFYYWRFSDGVNLSGRLIKRGFSQIGSYSVQLYVTNDVCSFNQTFTFDVSSIGRGEALNIPPLKLYPNPTEKSLFIEGARLHSVILLDAMGREIFYRINLNDDKIEIDLSPLPAGIYGARVTTVEGKTEVHKVIKR